MKRGLLFLVLGAVVVGAILFFGYYTSAYNRMVQADEKVKASWAQVQNVYQRRMDLIPNLVETVKGVANFEKETYIGVAEARAKASQVQLGPEILNDPEAFRKFQEAQGQLSGALSRLLVTVEKYPELKANQNFLELQSQLEGTENRITVERQRFNDTAREYNAMIRKIPDNIVAQIAGFKARPYFEAAEGAQTAPKVQF